LYSFITFKVYKLTMETSNQPTVKDQITAKQVIQGLMHNKNLTEVAKGMGLTRGGLYLRMNKAEVQEIMTAEVREMETKLQNWIQDLHDSPSPANQRHATSELGKIVKHVQDKVYPSIFRHENLNVTIDLTHHLQTEQIHTETISRMPPSMRTLYKQIHDTVTKELTT